MNTHTFIVLIALWSLVGTAWLLAEYSLTHWERASSRGITARGILTGPPGWILLLLDWILPILLKRREPRAKLA